jgi:hypothetical protein
MFKCELCGNEYKIINGYHLKKFHNMTVSEYRKLFPNSEMGFSKRKHQIKKTCMKKYGVCNVSQLKTIKDKKKRTCIHNYGVEFPAQSEKIQEKTKEKYIQLYGVDNPSKCESIKEKMRKSFLKNYGVDNPLKCEEIKEKMQNTMIEKYNSKTYKESEVYIRKYVEDHSFLFTVEEYKIEDSKIMVHCKNHNCPNSKEQGGWFAPTSTQLHERMRNVEQFGLDNSYFYCSQECKLECPLYGLRNDPYIKSRNDYYSDEEYKQFREYVLERDGYKCQYCGDSAEHVHHERPKKLEPFYSLDPDYAWSVCKECHYKYGHKDECSTGNLSKKIC